MSKGIADLRYRRMLSILTEARKVANMSQGEVAKRLGKPQQFVSRYELGERRLDIAEFVDVAAALGLDPLETLEETMRGTCAT